MNKLYGDIVNNFNIGIHTFMISRKLSYKEYSDLFEKLYTHEYISKKSIDGKSYESSYFWKNGYIGLTVRITKSIDFCKLSLIVNPLYVLNNEINYLGIYTDEANDSDEMFKRLNLALDLVNMDLSEFTLSRIDICANIEFIYSELTKRYLKIASDSILINKNSNLKKKRFSNETNNFKDINKHSVTFSNTQYELSFYDKQYQMKERNFDNQITNDFGKILRIEYRILNNYIYNNLKESVQHRFKFYLENSKKLLIDRISQFYILGYHFKRKQLHKFVIEANYYTAVKDRMIDISIGYKNLMDSIEYIKTVDKATDRKINVALDNFKQMNINPSCIPNYSLFNCLPSISLLIKDIYEVKSDIDEQKNPPVT